MDRDIGRRRLSFLAELELTAAGARKRTVAFVLRGLLVAGICFNGVLVCGLTPTDVFADGFGVSGAAGDDERGGPNSGPNENETDHAAGTDDEFAEFSEFEFGHDPVERVVESGSVVLPGRELFEIDFQYYGGYDGNADGVGPMFNQVSCVARHNQGHDRDPQFV